MAPKPLMPLDQAWARLAKAVKAHVDAAPSGRTTERIDSLNALGRVLAESVTSPVNVPPLDNSAMDGYALRVADLVQAKSLPVSQRVAAGQVGTVLQPGTCARIFTGAPVPEGADAVVMQEHTQTDEQGKVVFTRDVQVGQNIRRCGEDVSQGQTVLTAGTRLRPAHLGMAAAVGRAHVEVFRRPRVAVLTTGNELVMPGEPLPAGSIYNSNRHTLRGLIEASGAQATDLGVVPDDLQATRAALRAAAQHHDLIITSGGVSVGEEDHLRAAVQAEGQLDFWALGIKPGKPFVFGSIKGQGDAESDRCLYMGLPGNPVASFVTFLLLVSPVVRVLAGEVWRLPKALHLPADFDWPHPDSRREFLRAQLTEQGTVTLFAHQGSGVLTSAAWADGLVDVSPMQSITRGQMVPFLPWSALG